MEKNRRAGTRGQARKSIDKTINFLEKQLKEINANLSKQMSENEEWQTKLECKRLINDSIPRAQAICLFWELHH